MFSQEWGVEYLKVDGWGPLRHKRVQWFIIFPIAALVIAPLLGKRLLLHIGQGARQIHPWQDAAPMGNPVTGVGANKEVDVPNHSSRSNMLNTKEIQDHCQANQGMATPSP